MKTIIFVLGGLQIIAGIAFATEAASAIHQILAAIAFGFGTVCLGLGGIISKIENKTTVKTEQLPDGSISVDGKFGGWKKQ